MSNLINAGLTRLFKTRIFYIALIVAVGFPIFFIVSEYISNLGISYDIDVSWAAVDYFFIECFTLLPGVMAILIALFIGREYSDGTIRNKLAAGYSRLTIYISNLVVCLSATLIFIAANFLTVIIMSNLLYHNSRTNVFRMSVQEIIKNGLLEFCVLAACTSIFLLFTMLIRSRTRAVIISMVAIAAAFILSEAVYEAVYPIELNAELYEEYFPTETIDYTNVSDEPKEIDMEKFMEEFAAEYKLIEYEMDAQRGSYLTGVKRTVYLFLDDFLPYCQSMKLSDFGFIYSAPPQAKRIVIYDFGTIIFMTALGILIFNRRELK